MRSLGFRSLVLGLALLVPLAGCRRKPPPAKPTLAAETAGTIWAGGLTSEEVSRFFHLPIGSNWLPWFVLTEMRQSDGRPFLENLARFGLLPDPSEEHNEERLPVGMTVHLPTDLVEFNVRFYGFTCAACHVGEGTVDGHTVRVLGAPGRFDARRFHEELVAGAGALLNDLGAMRAVMLMYYDEVTRASEDMTDPTGLKRVLIQQALAGAAPADEQALLTSLRGDLARIHQGVRRMPAPEVARRDPLLGRGNGDQPGPLTSAKTRALVARISPETPAPRVAPPSSLADIAAADRLPVIEGLLSDVHRVLRVMRVRIDQARSAAERAQPPARIPALWDGVKGDGRVEPGRASTMTNHALTQAVALGALVDENKRPRVLSSNIEQLVRMSLKVTPPPGPTSGALGGGP